MKLVVLVAAVGLVGLWALARAEQERVVRRRIVKRAMKECSDE